MIATSPFGRIKYFPVLLLTVVLFLPCLRLGAAVSGLKVLNTPSDALDCVTIVGNQSDAVIIVDSGDYPVVQLAANLFADDVQRVTGHRPAVTNAVVATQLIIAGTLGHSTLIDKLAADGKLQGLNDIKGHWEATLSQVVDDPYPGVQRALVIVGSDRRGTAYGLIQLSQRIGVSPWYWWADVPVRHQDKLAVELAAPREDAPGVKYRGIFINDEDWGINPWASKTFDPQFGNIGPKTYERVFELMLRLRLNYIWPAMHACSTEFGSVPENIALADKYGIVAGSSHCEPMLYNNVHWNETEKGKWNYSLNRDVIHSYWEDNAKARGADEAVWTLGIRGIHDAAMERPPTAMPDKLKLMTQVITDQRALLSQYVTNQWGLVAQCFVPYKEVLPIYDAGLKVPDDVTLVWVDDNFGYIRRLSSPAERQRAGGAGIYWHISYYGSPHSYTWINTTAPALMWEELHKAWDNGTRTIWMLNVGDIKPMEIGIDYYSRLAWDPDGFNLGGQTDFLRDYAAQNFGESLAQPIAELLNDFYHLGTIRKPELMDRAWALSLTPDRAAQLEAEYNHLRTQEEALAAAVPPDARDAYTEMIGFPARVLAETGLIFMADRNVQLGIDVADNQNQITSLRTDLQIQVDDFNTTIADGKWDDMMPGLVTGKDLTKWSSEVRWPWGETSSTPAQSEANTVDHPPAGQGWRDADTADHQSVGAAQWSMIEGLGPSGRAMSLQPASIDAFMKTRIQIAPSLGYDFVSKGGDAAAFVDFLPTFRLYPGMKLRVAVSVDDAAPALVEVPGSSGAENENGPIRSFAVQNNYVRARVPLPGLSPGKHTLWIRAVDPGAVLDQISLP
jgi:Glycosyl hydrolase family 115/Gylcosyl hydrolase family 115 C-terminal domain